jgi:hypothetical protein
MVSTAVLTYLIGQKKKDAKVLLKNGRHAAAVYLMGYVLEYALKRKICSTLMFTHGFPESGAELHTYITALNANPAIVVNPVTFTDIREIRNHDLNKLLVYSGAELRVKSNFFSDWSNVASWNPENRYVRQHFSKVKAAQFIRSANKTVKLSNFAL